MAITRAPRQLLHRRVTADVIEVRMAREHDLDIPHPESELLDVCRDHRRHLRGPCVDQDVALRRGDEIGRNILCAHVVDVANQPERLLRLAVRTVKLGALFRRQRRGLRGHHKYARDH
jgi:hypothetical protein